MNKNFIIKIWKGEWPLVKTYWITGVVLAIPIFLPSYYFEHNFDQLSEVMSAVGVFYILFLYTYLIWINVSIWRSSSFYIASKKNKKESPFWGYTAKVLVILGLLRAIADLLKNLLI